MKTFHVHLYINSGYWKTDVISLDLVFRHIYKVVIDCPGIKVLEFIIRRLAFSSGGDETRQDNFVYIGTLNDEKLKLVDGKVKLK